MSLVGDGETEHRSDVFAVPWKIRRDRPFKYQFESIALFAPALTCGSKQPGRRWLGELHVSAPSLCYEVERVSGTGPATYSVPTTGSVPR